MKLTKETLAEAMGGISPRLISEAAPGSRELRERRAWRYTVRAAAAALVFTAVIFAAAALRPGGGYVTPGDSLGVNVPPDQDPDPGKRYSTSVIDGLDFKVEYTLSDSDPDSDGVITSVSVSAPEGYEAKFSDTQEQYFEKMLLEVAHDGERFCVVCDVRHGGKVDDFMREAEYTGATPDAVYSWETLAENGVGAVTWRYDKSGITFVAAAGEVQEQAGGDRNICALWAYDPREGSRLYSVPLTDEDGRNYFGARLSLFPKNGSFAMSSGDGSMFAMLWDYVDFIENGDIATDGIDWSHAEYTDSFNDVYAVEASELLPLLHYDYKTESTGKISTVILTFKDEEAAYHVYEINLRSDSIKDISKVPATNEPDETETPGETETMPDLTGSGAYDFTEEDMCLVKFVGDITRIKVPSVFLKIGPRAFSQARSTEYINKITLSKNIKQIDPTAFFFLKSLTSVEVDEANPSFKVKKIDENTSILYGLDEKIVFYFSPGGMIPDELYDMLPDSYMEAGAEVTFVYKNAVFDLFRPDEKAEEDGDIVFYCRSIKYFNNTVSFDEPVPFVRGIKGTQLFESADSQLVLQTNCYYNYADIYYVTVSTPSAIELHGLRGLTVSFYLDDKKLLRYRAMRIGFDILDQTMGADAFSFITDRSSFYCAEGTVSAKWCEFEFEREKTYTISDYFEMNGTDIDTAFKELGFDEYYDSLDSLFEANRKNAGDSD